MLKTCPLCGHDVDLITYHRAPGLWWVSVECDCGISFDADVFAETSEEAVREGERMWNRRSH